MAELKQLPDVVDLSFVAGDTFKIRVRILDPTTPEPTDLGGYKITADIKKSYSDSGAIGGFDVYLPDGTLIYEDTNASALIPPGTTEVILALDPTETMGLLSAGGGVEFTGVWDLEITFKVPVGSPAGTKGDVRTVAKGAVHCYLDVTTTAGV